MNDDLDQDLSYIPRDWADDLVQSERLDPRFATGIEMDSDNLHGTDKEDTWQEPWKIVSPEFGAMLPGQPPPSATQGNERCGPGADLVLLDPALVEANSSDRLVVLNSEQYRLSAGGLLSFDQAQDIYARLRNGESGTVGADHRRRPSLWMAEETSLLQWIVIVYCDQKLVTPPQFVPDYFYNNRSH